MKKILKDSDPNVILQGIRGLLVFKKDESIEKILNTCEPIINNEVDITEVDDGTIDILMQTLVSDNDNVSEKRKTWLILVLENIVNAVIFVETRIVDVLKYLKYILHLGSLYHL